MIKDTLTLYILAFMVAYALTQVTLIDISIEPKLIIEKMEVII